MSEAKIKQLTDVNNDPVYPVTLADSTYVKKQDENGKEYFDDLNSVIADIYDKLLWKDLTFGNLTLNPPTSVYEVGSIISGLKISWTTSKKPESLILNNGGSNVSIPPNDTNSYQYVNTTDVTSAVAAKKNYQVTATYPDKEGIPTSKSSGTKTIEFVWPVFGGYIYDDNTLSNLDLSTITDKDKRVQSSTTFTFTNISINAQDSDPNTPIGFYVAVYSDRTSVKDKDKITCVDLGALNATVELTYWGPKTYNGNTYRIYQRVLQGQLNSDKGWQFVL